MRFIQSGSKWEELAGYSRAVVDGQWVFISGTVGQDFASGTFPTTAREQAQRAMATIADTLKDAGCTLRDVVRVRVYVPDRNDVVAVSEVLRESFDTHRPTNTTVCSPLPVEAAKVEIEVTAHKRS